MKYSDEQVKRALELYDELQSVSKVIQRLGYPSKQGLYTWVGAKGRLQQAKGPRKRYNNTPEHPIHPPLSLKIDILRRCFELGENVQLVSEETGYSRSSIYTWRKKYILYGATALMNTKDDQRGKLPEGRSASTEEVALLKTQIQQMQLEIDLLKETIEVLKKDPGVDLTALKNREKAVMIDAMRGKYALPILLDRLQMAKSSYYYQLAVAARPKEDDRITRRVVELFHENSRRYGYRRIHALLAREGKRVSEKVVRRIMAHEDLVVPGKKRAKYRSYSGEITPAVPNLIERNFHAAAPNQKWLTDITEFAIPAGKVYLSPILDCFDGLLHAWEIGIAPNAELSNGMLQRAISTLDKDDHPTVHTDRGCHYRWPSWISLMQNAGLPRSMSKKGCTPDNAACEGLFGRIKNEMFYHRNWAGVSIEQFIRILNDYLIWYNEKRIKVSLGNRSPLEYRQSLRLAS
jgi:putative transposase